LGGCTSKPSILDLLQDENVKRLITDRVKKNFAGDKAHKILEILVLFINKN
jgi:hypothetical protein